MSDSLYHNSTLHFPHDTWPGATECARIAQAKLFDLSIPGGTATEDAIIRGYSKVARINSPRSPFLLLPPPLPSLKIRLNFSLVHRAGIRA